MKESIIDDDLAQGVMLDKSYLINDGERPKYSSLVEEGAARTVHVSSIQNMLTLENDMITRHTRNGASTRTFIENRRPRRFSSTDTVQSIILSIHNPNEEEDSKV
jgi:hypothetical protein